MVNDALPVAPAGSVNIRESVSTPFTLRVASRTPSTSPTLVISASTVASCPGSTRAGVTTRELTSSSAGFSTLRVPVSPLTSMV